MCCEEYAVTETLRYHVRLRPFRAALCLLSALALLGLLLHETATWAQLQVFGGRLAALETTAPAPDSVATLRFDFRGESVHLDVPFSRDALRDERALDFSPSFEKRGSWRGRYLTAVVSREASTRFMNGLADSLRKQRNQMGLDDDTYLELIVMAVQSIPYGTVGEPLKTPLEVVATGSGVCTEKSLLLASLLMHEGYSAGVWSLYGHSHVGVAVRTDGRGFRGSGYLFVETTKPSYVGQLPAGYAGSGPIHTRPQLIEIAAGRVYRADSQVSYILWLRDSADRAARGRGASGRITGPLATRPVDRSTAQRLVRWIDWNSHDRERVFERLTMAAAGQRDILLGGP